MLLKLKNKIKGKNKRKPSFCWVLYFKRRSICLYGLLTFERSSNLAQILEKNSSSLYTVPRKKELINRFITTVRVPRSYSIFRSKDKQNPDLQKQQQKKPCHPDPWLRLLSPRPSPWSSPPKNLRRTLNLRSLN